MQKNETRAERHRRGLLLHLQEAEAGAFAVSTKHGRAWKAAYEEARRTHTVAKAIEIADKVAKIVGT